MSKKALITVASDMKSSSENENGMKMKVAPTCA
jgi:hypothetical protein